MPGLSQPKQIRTETRSGPDEVSGITCPPQEAHSTLWRNYIRHLHHASRSQDFAKSIIFRGVRVFLVQQTIDEDLPYETEFLRRYDQFRASVETMFDMPERTMDLLFRFLNQNEGKLSARARRREFAALSDTETARVEAIYRDLFADDGGASIG